MNYATLNCNRLIKVRSPATQSSFIRHLRIQQFDILCLQETHASPLTIPNLNMQLQAQQTFWTYHCGIVFFSTEYITTDHIFQSDRIILCKVQRPNDFYAPFYILNIYAPADSDSNRKTFLQQLYNMLIQMSDTLSMDHLIISGDWNYDYDRDTQNGRIDYKISSEWVSYMKDLFYNCMRYNNMNSCQHSIEARGYFCYRLHLYW